MRFLIACFSVIFVYFAPVIFGEMSLQYLAESALKSVIIIAVCDYCRKDFKDLALIIAIECFMCASYVIIAIQHDVMQYNRLLSDLCTAAFILELSILIKAGWMIARSSYSISYNRRRDDLRSNDSLEGIA